MAKTLDDAPGLICPSTTKFIILDEVDDSGFVKSIKLRTDNDSWVGEEINSSDIPVLSDEEEAARQMYGLALEKIEKRAGSDNPVIWYSTDNLGIRKKQTTYDEFMDIARGLGPNAKKSWELVNVLRV